MMRMGPYGRPARPNPTTPPDAAPRHIADCLRPESIHIDVPLRDQVHAFEFMAHAIATRHGLEPGPVLRALWRREQAGSTGLGAGFAIPHARIAGIDRPLTLLLRARRPIEFKAIDREPVWLMLAILVPGHGDRADHLALLALVAELFSDPQLRARIDTGATPAAVDQAFRDGLARLQGTKR